jgi:hypothetical protein
VTDAVFAVGIDLGTTHTALARAALGQPGARPEVVQVPQLVARGVVEARPLLPSFVYFAHPSEGPLALPWDQERRFAVGELARARSTDAPTRVVASAKSWLSHTGIDRRASVLPLGAPADVEKISPVEAAWRILDHLSEAWQAAYGSSAKPLGEQPVVLTVPASFDAAARDLTVEAAYAAGLEDVTLLEEPQAALYAWIDAQGNAWREHLQVGDIVLVVDIGGGTTDFSAISAMDREGELELRRIAVGDHILLGGDNMDLALAHALRAGLPDQGTSLDRWQFAALTHACRSAKEQLLQGSGPQRAPVVVAERGSALVGGALRLELDRELLDRVLVEGFFPEVGPEARPALRQRSALTEIGLPYAADPAVTRHLAAFLVRQAAAGAARRSADEATSGSSSQGARILPFTKVLLNGGVLKAPLLRERLLATLNRWLGLQGCAPAALLPGDDPELAVARGAAYFGLVRRGRGIRIRGGTARAYYVGVESPMPAVPGLEPPITAVCVAPFGMDEGSDAQVLDRELGLVVGEPVSFRFFGSTVRRDDAVGTDVERWAPGELEELAPIEVTLPAEGRVEGDVVPVRLSAQITPVGTLLLEAVPAKPIAEDERWKLELNVRGR